MFLRFLNTEALKLNLTTALTQIARKYVTIHVCDA